MKLLGIKKPCNHLIYRALLDFDKFSVEKVALVGGKIIKLDAVKNIDTKIKILYTNALKIISCTKESNLGTISISKKTNPHDLEIIDLAIINGEFGVAENDAVWVSEDQFLVRTLPFITNDLVLILDKKKVCLNLHQAYTLIAKRERNFGLFISGPSRTADIEQCLVDWSLRCNEFNCFYN